MSVVLTMLRDVAEDRLSIDAACERLNVADHAVRDELVQAATSLQIEGAEARAAGWLLAYVLFERREQDSQDPLMAQMSADAAQGFDDSASAWLWRHR